MFQNNNIEILKEDLQPLFDVADKSHKNSLNFDEFKNCAFEYEHKKTVNSYFFEKYYFKEEK